MNPTTPLRAQTGSGEQPGGGPPTPQPKLPEFIGGYRILGVLGAGGMGVVYEAEQQSPKRRVALKVIRPAFSLDENQSRMFRREIETLGRLKHPNIATIYESGRTEDGQDFFAMEMVQGKTMEAWLAGRPSPITSAELDLRLKLFRTLCDAVNYAHLRGVIHRDLKPANIIVLDGPVDGTSSFQGIPTLKVLDFGLARLVDAEARGSLLQTEFGQVLGTLQYMSPEQARGETDIIDVRTDVYTLGLILYELTLNRRPYDLGKTVVSLAFMIICEQAPKPWDKSWRDARRPEPDLWTILEKALEKEPDRRYGSAASLGEDIDRFLSSQPIVARPPSGAYRTRMFLRRYRTGVGFAAALFLLTAGFAVAMAVQVRRVAREAEISRNVSAFLKSTFEIWNPATARGKTYSPKEVLDYAARRIDLGGVKDPRIQASLMSTLGSVYESVGLPGSAQPMYERALDIQRRQLGPRHPDTLASMDGLADVFLKQGRFPEAMALAQETLWLRRGVLGREHPDTLITMGTLAWVSYGQGRYAEAEQQSLEALVLMRKVLGPEHAETLNMVNALASALIGLERFPEAEKLYREALQGQRGRSGEDSPTTLSCMNNLAVVVMAQGRYVEAENLYRETLELNRRVLGPNDSKIMVAMNNLASAIVGQGRIAEAEKLYQETLELSRRVLGPTHPETIATMANLATAVGRMPGRLPEAERLSLEVLQLRRRALGPEHPDTLLSLVNLAMAIRAQGRLGEAGRLLQEALLLRRRALGPGHPETIATSATLGLVLLEEHRYPESELVYRETIEAQQRVFGPDHPTLLPNQYNLACLAALQGHTEEALSLLEAMGRSHYLTTYSERIGVSKDPDLASLRGTPRFEALVRRFNAPADQPAKQAPAEHAGRP